MFTLNNECYEAGKEMQNYGIFFYIWSPNEILMPQITSTITFEYILKRVEFMI